MLELGQPTHPYDLRRLPGRGLLVRRARAGETIETLDGVTRTVGARGRSLGDTGEDCLICDAEGTPVGIAGIMGGASSEIADTTTEVLLEAAYFAPMAIARTSKRLGLRTEASARFERGCDPVGIEPAVRRFCQLLAESVPGLRVADGMLDIRGDVPDPFVVSVPVARVHSQIGVALGREQIARLLDPIGFTVMEQTGADADAVVTVIVPTNRPDVRPEPFGVADVIEEIARTFGYGNIPRRVPVWPQPGRLDRAATVAALHQGHPVRSGCVGGLDRLVRLGLGARRRRAHRTGGPGGQPARRGEAVPAALRDARSPCGAVVQRQPPPTRRAPLRGGRRVLAPRRRIAAGGRARRRRRGGVCRAARRARDVGGRVRPGDRRCPQAVAVVACDRRGAPPRRRPPGGARRRAPALSRPAPDALRPSRRGRRGRGTRCSAPSAKSTRASRRASGSPGPRAPARRRAGSAGWRSTWACSSTRRRCPVGARSGAPSAGSRRRTSTWRSWWRTAIPPTWWATSCGWPEATCSSRSRLFDVYRGTGIDEGARSLAYRLRFCSPETAPSPTRRSPGCGRAASKRSSEEFGAVLR